MQLARIGHRDDERRVVRLERHEVVPEHHLGRNAAEKLGIDALLAQVDEWAPIALGEAPSLIALGGFIGRVSERW